MKLLKGHMRRGKRRENRQYVVLSLIFSIYIYEKVKKEITEINIKYKPFLLTKYMHALTQNNASLCKNQNMNFEDTIYLCTIYINYFYFVMMWHLT